MNQQDVIAFFDSLAPTWDAVMKKDDAVIETILDNARVRPGGDVLDVACGTGVLFPYYLRRRPASITAIDISPEMMRVAKNKPAAAGIALLVGDVEAAHFDRRFDSIVVYNAFPHFPNPRRLVARLSCLLKQGGTLTVAHGASRAAINRHHEGAARHVSQGLMPAEDLAALFAERLQVTAVISDERMYQVAGRAGADRKEQ